MPSLVPRLQARSLGTRLDKTVLLAEMRQRYSSLPLQVVIYFNGWYLALLYLAELALTAYKGK